MLNFQQFSKQEVRGYSREVEYWAKEIFEPLKKYIKEAVLERESKIEISDEALFEVVNRLRKKHNTPAPIFNVKVKNSNYIAVGGRYRPLYWNNWDKKPAYHVIELEINFDFDKVDKSDLPSILGKAKSTLIHELYHLFENIWTRKRGTSSFSTHTTGKGQKSSYIRLLAYNVYVSTDSEIRARLQEIGLMFDQGRSISDIIGSSQVEDLARLWKYDSTFEKNIFYYAFNKGDAQGDLETFKNRIAKAGIIESSKLKDAKIPDLIEILAPYFKKRGQYAKKLLYRMATEHIESPSKFKEFDQKAKEMEQKIREEQKKGIVDKIKELPKRFWKWFWH